MNVSINTNIEFKSNLLQNKPSFRQDGTYRIIHVTKKVKDESDDDDNDHCNVCTSNELNVHMVDEQKTNYNRKSLKTYHQNRSDRWKRKSTKTKCLLNVPSISSESSSVDTRDSPLAGHLTNNISAIITLKDTTLKADEKEHYVGESVVTAALLDVFDEAIFHDDTTLNDLLDRAGKLETTVKLQDFNKIQLQPQTVLYRKRKRTIIALSTVITVFIIVIIIIIFAVVLTLKYKTQTNETSKSFMIPDRNR